MAFHPRGRGACRNLLAVHRGGRGDRRHGHGLGGVLRIEEIWATKAPRTMAREATTNRSFQPVAFETLKLIVFWVWVVMAFSVPRRGFESLS